MKPLQSTSNLRLALGPDGSSAAMGSFHVRKTGLRIYEPSDCHSGFIGTLEANELVCQSDLRTSEHNADTREGEDKGTAQWQTQELSSQASHRRHAGSRLRRHLTWNTDTNGHVSHAEPPFLSLLSEEHTSAFQETGESPVATLASLRLGHPLPDEPTRIVHRRRWLKLHGLHHVAVADTDLQGQGHHLPRWFEDSHSECLENTKRQTLMVMIIVLREKH